MIQNLFNDMTELLRKQAPDFFVNDKLNKNKVTDAAYSYDKNLLKALLTNDSLKKQFFVEVEKNLVFKQREFLMFLNNKSFLQDSYTRFKNEIGLQDEEGRYFRENTDVVLVWPHKDCILEGGQTKEDQSREEVFYNETLAPDEIDRLLDTKALTNFTLYDKTGKKELKANTELNLREQNLIIRGNNLLALHSLKARKDIAGKVKLIYIDPPYNTGNDGFRYNDKFNHSSWLTFLRDRLKIAKQLLSKDGIIFCSINHIELGYSLIIFDEIFGKENKLPIITLKAGTTASYRSINDCPVNVSEYVLIYSKSNNFKPNPVYRESSYSEDYSHYIKNIEDKSNNWELEKITDIIHKDEGCNDWREFRKKFGARWKKIRFDKMEEFAIKNKENVVSLNTLQKPSQKIQEVIDKSFKNRDMVFQCEREGADPIYCYNGRTLAFFSSKFREIEGSVVPTEILTNIWADVSFLGIGPEGGVSFPNGKKPEYLLKTILELSTKENDIVLDYHLGSGTTAAVAQKMKRRYIGIEQLDYDRNDSVHRLQNVIAGDTSGISQYDDIDWKGGGQFLYCELKEHNQKYIKGIQSAKNFEDLYKIWETMKSEAFLRIEIDKDKFTEDSFNQLELEEQKRLLLETLDKNHLYVNLSEMEDEEHKMTKDEIELNKKFYNI